MVSPNKEFVFFQNYKDILTAPEVLKSFINTIVYIGLLLIFNFLIPYIIGFILAMLVTKYKGFYKSVIFLPSIISTVVGSLIYLWIFNPLSGPIAIFLSKFDIQSPFWIKTNGLVILVLSIVTAWKSFGYNLIILLSSIIEVPRELIEQAKLDNLSNSQIFVKIILPLTSSTALYVLIVTVVFGLQYVFVPINVITQGGPDNASTNLVYSIYQYGFTFFQTGKASALAVITTAFFFILMLVKFKVLEKGVYYEN
jgi:sn-glycerol 3-phosphate transport system permease protein